GHQKFALTDSRVFAPGLVAHHFALEALIQPWFYFIFKDFLPDYVGDRVTGNVASSQSPPLQECAVYEEVVMLAVNDANHGIEVFNNFFVLLQDLLGLLTPVNFGERPLERA